MAIAAVAFGAAALFQGHRESRKARRAEANARAAEQRRAGAEQARQARKTREAARVQRGAIVAQAAASGGGGTGSSASQGAQGSIGSSAAETVGFSQVQLGYANAISNFQGQANRYASRAQTFNTLGQLAINNAGTIGKAVG